MTPELSPVRAMRASGFQVYLVEWSGRAQESSESGMSAFADTTLSECITAIREETGQRHAFLAGHSLGGTFAAIFASLHPACVRGLVGLEAPLAFEDGALTLAASFISPEQIDLLPPVIPGTMLNELSSSADPYTYQVEPWIDWLASAPAHASDVHWRVRRWTLDEFPWPKLLFKEVLTFLYRENRFVRRRLHIGSRLADPQAIVAPILVVADPRSRIVPPRSIEPYRTGTRCHDLKILDYLGDTGVVMQHVGVLVGHNAHRGVWPQIVSWLRDRA
jgi:poly[(R)-3-hydroxyalkanoate] polymerase subunit PhaC